MAFKYGRKECQREIQLPYLTKKRYWFNRVYFGQFKWGNVLWQFSAEVTFDKLLSEKSKANTGKNFAITEGVR